MAYFKSQDVSKTLSKVEVTREQKAELHSLPEFKADPRHSWATNMSFQEAMQLSSAKLILCRILERDNFDVYIGVELKETFDLRLLES